MNIDLTEKWAKEIALMSDADFEENCKYIETLLNRRKQTLRIHDVSGSLPIFKCKCGYETSDSVSWCVHADCCNGNDR